MLNKTNIFNLYIASALLFTSATFSLEGVIETRAAVDIGSKGLKVTVADIDLETNSIVKIYYSHEHYVPLKRDMEVSGKPYFSDTVQQLAIDTLAKLQHQLAQYNPVEWSGIATAASRESQNAQAFYDRIRNELGVNIQIITQEEEGRIGFNTAAAISGLDASNIISYDSGGGSFQLSTQIGNAMEVVQGKFAHIISLATLIKEIRKQPLNIGSSPNPVTFEEANQLVPMLQARLPVMSEAFARKLHEQRTTVIGIGNGNFIFAFGAIATGKNTYTKQELWAAIEAHCGKSDAELKKFLKPDESVVGMVLLYSVMDGFGIDKLTYSFANGSCEGLLVDSKYWTNQRAAQVN